MKNILVKADESATGTDLKKIIQEKIDILVHTHKKTGDRFSSLAIIQ